MPARQLSYWSRMLLGVPLFFVVALTRNAWRLNKQALDWTVAECREVISAIDRNFGSSARPVAPRARRSPDR